jgi:hypothetical protein
VTDTRASARRTATLVAVPAALLAGVLAFVALGGFDRAAPPVAGFTPVPSGPVTFPASPLSGTAASACRALLAGLPAALGDAARRPVDGGADRTAAYGDPPIALTCGGPQFVAPSTPPADAEEGFYGLSEVCWYVIKTPVGTTWSTMDRETPVTVQVPSAYQEPAQRVIVFSDAILAALPTVTEIQAGCR